MFSLESEPVGLSYVNPVEVGNFNTEEPNIVSFGFGAGRVGNDASSGPLPTLGFRLGYLVSPQLVVGANLFFMGITASSTGDVDLGNGFAYETKTKFSAFGAGLTPFVHYIFSTEGAFRPYGEFRFGFGAHRSWGKFKSEQPLQPLETKSVTETVTPRVGIAGGVHVFLSDAVSLDVGLTFDYIAPYARPVKYVSTTEDGTVTFKNSGDYQKASNGFNLGIPLGISIWM